MDLVECETEAYKTYECVVSRKHVCVSHKSCQWYHHRDSSLLRNSWIPRRRYDVCCSVPRSVRCSVRCRLESITQFVDRVTLLQYVLQCTTLWMLQCVLQCALQTRMYYAVGGYRDVVATSLVRRSVCCSVCCSVCTVASVHYAVRGYRDLSRHHKKDSIPPPSKRRLDER